MKTKPKSLFSLCSLLLVLVTAACKSTSAQSGTREMRWSERTIESDPGLASEVRMLDARFVEDRALRSAHFALLLVDGARRDLLVHVEWFDILGAPIDLRPQGWIPVELTANTPVELRVEAPSGAARSFRLRFQRPDAVR